MLVAAGDRTKDGGTGRWKHTTYHLEPLQAFSCILIHDFQMAMIPRIGFRERRRDNVRMLGVRKREAR